MSYFEGARELGDEISMEDFLGETEIEDSIEVTNDAATKDRLKDETTLIYSQPDTNPPPSAVTTIYNNVVYWTPAFFILGGVLLFTRFFSANKSLLAEWIYNTYPKFEGLDWIQWIGFMAPTLVGLAMLYRLYGPEKQRRNAEQSNQEKKKEWDRLETEMVSGLQQEAFALLE